MIHQCLKTQVSNSRDVLQCYASSQAGDQQQKRKQNKKVLPLTSSLLQQELAVDFLMEFLSEMRNKVHFDDFAEAFLHLGWLEP